MSASMAAKTEILKRVSDMSVAMATAVVADLELPDEEMKGMDRAKEMWESLKADKDFFPLLEFVRSIGAEDATEAAKKVVEWTYVARGSSLGSSFLVKWLVTAGIVFGDIGKDGYETALQFLDYETKKWLVMTNIDTYADAVPTILAGMDTASLNYLKATDCFPVQCADEIVARVLTEQLSKGKDNE